MAKFEETLVFLVLSVDDGLVMSMTTHPGEGVHRVGLMTTAIYMYVGTNKTNKTPYPKERTTTHTKTGIATFEGPNFKLQN